MPVTATIKKAMDRKKVIRRLLMNLASFAYAAVCIFDSIRLTVCDKIKYQYLKFPSFTYTLKSLMPPGTLLSMRGKYWMAVRVCFAPKSITTV